MDASLPPVSARIVSAERTVRAPASGPFELIADPARQPEWDGNNNLAGAAAGQRVEAVGDVFTTVLTQDGAVRENHVVEFAERTGGTGGAPGLESPAEPTDGH